MKNISIIQRNIRYERIIAGLLQKQLAEKLGCSDSLITQWESGWTNVTDKWIIKIAAVFEISLERLTAKDPKNIVMKELIRDQILESTKNLRHTLERCENKLDKVLHLMR